jgi:hypothetical protein
MIQITRIKLLDQAFRKGLSERRQKNQAFGKSLSKRRRKLEQKRKRRIKLGTNLDQAFR